MSPRLKRLLTTAAGLAVVAASLAYLAALLGRVDPRLLADSVRPGIWPKAVVMVAVCGASVFVPALAWRALLHALEDRRLAFRPAAAVYVRTFLARYLPGNIFHFVGRQVLGAGLGAGQKSLALASILETGSLLGVSLVVFVIPGLALGLYAGAAWEVLPVRLDRMMLAGCLGVLGCLVWFLWRRLSARKEASGPPLWKALLGANACYVLFLAANGLVLFGVYSSCLFTGMAFTDLPVLLSASVFAWMGGFVTPGAPGGLGVREALLVMLLSGRMDPGVALLGAILFRILTILGEISAFSLTLAWKKSSASPDSVP